ncbi:Alpha/Beta hydrolase protein [Delphinella strobiligena]|nr:Alpha/Beta hydrolase protein [Delphinella strobiligena]
MSSNTSFRDRFQPAEETRNGHSIVQYRGIKYGNITRRFASPEEMAYENDTKTVNCTEFGPICPQVSTDYHHLLRIPESMKALERQARQDEFQCLNLDITLPANVTSKLPVMIWIHGGSQVMTFMPAASPCADVVPLVVDSIEQNKPMIEVFINYRVNIFAFGDGKGAKNLALKDQRLAIKWVSKHIESFGGDPSNITLAGESAGAVYVHAHLLTGAPVRRGILQSGSLHLSPPQGEGRGLALCQGLEETLSKQGFTLASAPVGKLLETLAEAKILSMWLQLTEELHGWETQTSPVDELLIGDCEYESVLWRNGIETMSASAIDSCFNSAGDEASQLKALYNIVPDRPTACKLGALDLINDTRFALPVMTLRESWRKAGKTVYDYIYDQVNPWQASSRAHHAVELVMLFSSLDLSHNSSAIAVRQDLRSKWLSFCNGAAPWSSEHTYAFGPHGRCGEIAATEYESRRRVQACRFLEQMGPSKYNTVFGQLAAGRISLLN